MTKKPVTINLHLTEMHGNQDAIAYIKKSNT